MPYKIKQRSSHDTLAMPLACSPIREPGGRLWPDRMPTTEPVEPGISQIDVSLRSLALPHILRKFTR